VRIIVSEEGRIDLKRREGKWAELKGPWKFGGTREPLLSKELQ
jgi:hypothetical protein